jgi:two-component system cell cycle sensor histidine kinase PleC
MLTGATEKRKSRSLMYEYSALVSDAVLRHRTRLAESKARLEIDLAHRIKSEFLANMSHELRTPLNTVIGFSKILSEHDRRKLPDAEIVQYSQMIRDAAANLLSVLNDILDISKIQSGNYALDAQEISVEEILHAVIASFKQTATDSGVTLKHRIAFNLPAVRGDTAKMKQIFSNLLSNAIKFNKSGGEAVIEAIEHGNGGVLISIRDTGVGMSEEEIRVALTMFGQVDGGRNRWREGTGLGLPIAKALVQLHGGELMIMSDKGQGTDATVILPPRNKVSLAEGREAVFGGGLST